METLERGDIHFLYTPAVEEEQPSGLVDVQNFHLALIPDGDGPARLLVVGRKRLPEVGETERLWGFVQVVGDEEALRERLTPEEYTTATRGRRHQPGARSAGAGRYALVARGRDTLLAYALAAPDEPGEVQQELNIAPEARYVLAVKNPTAGSPPEAGLAPEQQVEFPDHLQERFEGRRWLAADPPAFLDYEGAEILLIGAAEDVDVGGGPEGTPDLDPDRVDDLYRRLRLDREEHPATPLIEGGWD